ncbi:hypothetical protein OQ279_07830 [Salinimicrobium sp. MT39]|uniref:Uncharacterized protein n=1 Tax=Salinimicrobium profundisediminis TaxID=2994553 RepID=A0A9X3CWJ1_9FLAO|nr:hypothetical protein [Salinimicrobium profundisediminis]MCX2838063.1 hypothetical protein [Salinimicrobium profundisediminis]
MKKILSFFTSLLFFSCANEASVSGELTDFLPQDPAVIVQMKNPDLFFSNIQNNDFLKLNSENELYIKIKEGLEILKYFPHQKEALLVLDPKAEKSLDFLFISRDNLKPKNLDSIPNRQVETMNFDDLEVQKYVLEGKTAFSTHIDSISLLSNSLPLLKETARGNSALSKDLQVAFKAASPKKTSVFLNSDKAAPFLKKLFLTPFSNFTKWTVVDTDISQNDIRLNGITIASDFLPRLINVFKGVGVSKNTLANITPVTSSGFNSVSFQDFKKLNENLLFLRGNETETTFTEEISLLTAASEAGSIHLAEGLVFAIRSAEAENGLQTLNYEAEQTEEFRGLPIYKFPHSNSFSEILQPLLDPEDLHFLTFLESYILFSETSEALKAVIAAFQDDLVLSNTEAYKTSSENLSSEASLLIVRNNQAEGANKTEQPDYTNYPITAIQYIYQDNFAHLHSVVAKSAALKTDKPTSQAANVTLAAPLNSPPVFFKNHRSNGMDIVAQDVQNTLYLISPEGKIHWKKDLGSPILGEVQTVDILKNGRYQLAFATQNEVHVIDRDGNPVKPFPLKFRDKITQPLSVFDYDKKRDYRFMVTQGREVYMYDRKGKGVKGFNFSKATSEIIQPPKHIRIGRKDYIVIPETSEKLNILSRSGKIRVPVKQDLNFSENAWYEYNGNFVSTNTSGQILKISEKGNVKKEDLGLAENTRITATEKTLVTLSENELSIKGNSVTLDFGLYAHPQIFFLNNKIYVSVTDLQAKKVYLFDSNASLIDGFPVYGNSLIDLSNADADAALELVVQGEENGILVYEVN